MTILDSGLLFWATLYIWYLQDYKRLINYRLINYQMLNTLLINNHKLQNGI